MTAGNWGGWEYLTLIAGTFTGSLGEKRAGVRGWLLRGEEQGALPTSAASSLRAQEKLHEAGGRGKKALERVTPI